MNDDRLRRTPAWLKSRWAKVLGGVLGALLVLSLIAPYLLNVDRYRGRISDIISLQTGRKVTLGRLRATILPRIGFSVEGFQMANPPGFAQGQLVRAEQIRGALAFWPLLLRRELRVISLELAEPRVMLLEDDRGRNNYSFPPRGSAQPGASGPVAAPAPRQTQASSRSASVTLMVDQVTMNHASVYYGTIDRRGRPAASVHISNLNVELRQLALHPLRIRDWQADARLGGTELTLSGWNTPLLFDSGMAMLRDGKIDSSFTVQLGRAARVEGVITVRDVEDAVPQFTLKTDSLDLNALLAGVAEPLPARGRNFNPAQPPAAARPRAPGLPGPSPAPPVTAAAGPTGPTRLVAQGHISAERVGQGAHTAGPLTADVRIYNDRTEIWPFTLRLAGGAVQLSARTDRRQAPQRFSANIQVRDLSTERLLGNSPALKGKFAGIAELEMQLIGSLETRWTESLTGYGQLAIRNGRIAGFNLTGAAQTIANLAGVSGDTPFTRIAGDFSIRNERITSRQIHMDSPRGTVDLQGSAGFYGALDYQGQMIAQLGGGSASPDANSARDILSSVVGSAVARNIGPTQISVPFILRGTLQQPQLRPGRTAPQFSRPAQASQSPQSGQPLDNHGSSFPNLFGR